MTETLKPCPFCGDKAVLKEALRWHGAFRVECSSCDATVWATGANNPASAIAHWNRRVAPHEPGEAERLMVEWYAAWKAEVGAWRARARAASSDARLFANAARVHDDARARLLVAESGMANFVEASRPDAGEPGEACPDCGYDVLVTDPDLRDPVEARVHAIDCPRTRYVVEYGVEAPPNVRHVRPHRSGCGHYDCSAPRPDAGDGTGEPG